MMQRGTARTSRSLLTCAALAMMSWFPSQQILAAPQNQNNQPPASQEPSLIVQITVDSLRGDLPTRYRDRLTPDGFRYLLENGTVFADAHHAHANNETIVGHTTLATGAHPATHGMVGNVWFDHETDHTTYNIEDSRYRLLTAGSGVDADTEIDPTQKAARVDGRSPAAIMTTTFSDELALKTAGKAKIFGISVKDRGAVSMAGHAGKAFWFSKQTGQFVTSTYYYQSYPAWVDAWNRESKAAAYAGTSWELMHDHSSYLYGKADDQPWETDLAGFGRTFPHPYGEADSRYMTTLLTTSPAGDALTLDFAQALITAEDLGGDAVTDYLSISFSSTDYVNHLFGASSLESEDQILRLDELLSRLFRFIEKHVGLDRTLIVLSADHGTPEAPGVMAEFGFPGAYVSPGDWDTAPALEQLKKKFGVGEELIEAYEHPYIYLNRDVMQDRNLDPAAVEKAVAAELAMFPRVATAVSSTLLRQGGLADTALNRAVLNNFHPKRSGDIFVVFESHSFINNFDGLEVATTHGMPWNYDNYVPLIFAGSDVPSQVIYRRVETVDVARTLAAFAGTLPPSGSAGHILAEALAGKRPHIQALHEHPASR